MRSIGDGIAWRLLSYDRTVLRLLAEHAPLSTPQLDSGWEAELRELIGLTQEQRMRCLLNAITNFLRVGDITAINPQTGAVTIREVKSGTTTTARTRRQSDYLMVVQEGIDSGIHPLGQMKLRRIVSEKPLKTHVRSIERALQEADQKLGASRVFGDYLAVAVVSQRLFETAPEEKWSGFSDPHFRRLGNVRSGSADFLLRMDNVIPFTHFSPNVAPYAVFPIDPGLRFGFMTGRYLVLSVLNVSGLAHWLERRGLQTEILVPEEETPPEDAFPDLPVLTVSSGQMTMQVGLTLLATASMEFWMRESIEEIIRVTMATGPASASQDEGYTHVVFPNTGKHAWD